MFCCALSAHSCVQGNQAPNPRFWSLTSTVRSSGSCLLFRCQNRIIPQTGSSMLSEASRLLPRRIALSEAHETLAHYDPAVSAASLFTPIAQVGKNYVIERYRLSDGRELQYKQPEGSFSNPNASVCIGTLNWLCDVSSGIEGAKVLPSCSLLAPATLSSLLPHVALRRPHKAAAAAAAQDCLFGRHHPMHQPAHHLLLSRSDLPSECVWADLAGMVVAHQEHDFLELYCGNGNHTVGEAD